MRSHLDPPEWVRLRVCLSQIRTLLPAFLSAPMISPCFFFSMRVPHSWQIGTCFPCYNSSLLSKSHKRDHFSNGEHRHLTCWSYSPVSPTRTYCVFPSFCSLNFLKLSNLRQPFRNWRIHSATLPYSTVFLQSTVHCSEQGQHCAFFDHPDAACVPNTINASSMNTTRTSQKVCTSKSKASLCKP